MYVCICNALNERRVCEALAETRAEGITPTVGRVYGRLGCRTRCGKCIGAAMALIDAAQDVGLIEQTPATVLAAE